jgi:F420-dependent oxidoreductase-like protein
MRISMGLKYAGGFREAVEEITDLERAGLDLVFVPEAYSFDAVSQLGYLARATERLELASGILQVLTRTPTLTAMTAAGLDFVSDGRFSLGIGASGPQVVEGFHGVPYDAPLGRMREIIEVCRKVWRREVLVHEGKHYQVPLPAGQGTGLGKPLKLINHPVRPDIPVIIAALGPQSVTMTAEIAEGWLPIFYFPERVQPVWGDAVAQGLARRDPGLRPLEVIASAPCAIGDDVDDLRDRSRPELALYVGGMGARGKNFYNELATKYGFEAEAKQVQDLYLDGHKAEAAAAVPQELVDGTSLVGSAGRVKDRLAALHESGVTTVNVSLPQGSREERLRTVERLRVLADDVG